MGKNAVPGGKKCPADVAGGAVGASARHATHRFCVAPMMARTDRHCRFFMRLLSKHAVLYTEMISCRALLHGDARRLLDFDASEYPLALQLGGSTARELAHCAQLGRRAGYPEINLNVGCPSARTGACGIGASMMRHPGHVAECVRAMDPSQALVSVKCRIGVDELDSESFLAEFATRVWEAGCGLLIVHARKALLNGLSPKQNRSIPELNYERVYQLKRCLPQLAIVINGGIDSIDACKEHLERVDGVMLGRAAYSNPMLLNAVDRELYGDDNARAHTPDSVLRALLRYAKRERNSNNTPIHKVLRHTPGLYKNVPNARHARRALVAVRAAQQLEELLARPAGELLPAESSPATSPAHAL